MIKFLPKIFLLVFSASLLFAGIAWAQPQQEESAWFEQSPQEFGKKLTKDKVSLEPFSFATFNNLANSLSIAGLGNPAAQPGSVSRQGAIGLLGNLIATLYSNPPASSGEYLAYLRQNLGLVEPTYAQQPQQGTGFTGLMPLLPIWTVFRNLAYAVFVLVFVITGLLIMFRLKINPQTVISIQSALPKLVLTLILITLSYAIVGFLIDLMYVLMFLVASIFSPIVKDINLSTRFGQNVLLLFWQMPGVGGTVIGQPAEIVGEIVNKIAAEGIAGNLLGLAVRGIAMAILTVAILWALVRLLFQLLKAYIFILAMLVFGPLQLLLGALPVGGGTLGLSGWLRTLIANLLVFPLTLGMFLFASALLAVRGPNPTESGWVAPFLGAGWGSTQFPGLLALGVILMTPTVVKMMEDAFKPPPFPYATAIGQAIGAGAGTAGAPFTIAGRAVSGGLMWGAQQRIARLVPGGLGPRQGAPPTAEGGIG